MKETTIKIEKGWLENLLRYADNVQKEIDKAVEEGDGRISSYNLSAILGYISSAETILKRDA